MKLQTSKLREELLKLEEPQERLEVLKNQYKDETRVHNSRGPIIKKI